jgi:hypothetical protein
MKSAYSSSLTACIAALAALAITSCKSVYEPNAVNTPLFNNRGEVRANIDPSNVQVAYAVTDHAGVMLNGFHAKENFDDNRIHGKGGLVELGLGCYTSKRPFVAEAYLGWGLGTVHFDETRQVEGVNKIYTFDANASRFFIQPSAGITTRFFDLAFTPRCVAGQYFNVRTNYSVKDQVDGKFYDVGKPLWMFVEPAVTARAGYKWVKFQVQFGWSHKLNAEPLNYKDSFVNIGLTFDLRRIYEEI